MPHRRTDHHTEERTPRRNSRRDRHEHDDEDVREDVTEAGTAATGEQPAAISTREPNRADSRPAMERAEGLVDEWGERLGHVARQAGEQVLRLAARAREEAEDIWAEAQSIRRGGRT
jgi:hypothetical protein